MAVKNTRSDAVRSVAARTGWLPDDKERRDFYHRVRTFPPEVGAWRKASLKFIVDNPSLFPGAKLAVDEADVRTLLDDGLSFLREVTRLLALLMNLEDSASAETLSKEGVRLFSRLRPYRELGLSLDGQSFAKRKALAERLMPPNLLGVFDEGARRLADAECRARAPRCHECELRNFCGSYRASLQDEVSETKRPTFVDLFCGAGGLTEGFKRAGFRPLACLDTDEMALRTYWLNHPEVPDGHILGRDIRTVQKGEMKKLVGRGGLDVLVGAPPCQGFSSAGFRSKRTRTGYRETRDDRNFLFEDMMRIAEELRPRLILLENVVGMSSARNGGRSFLDEAARVLKERLGYTSAVWKLNAASFGVPQDRRRVFLVASRDQSLPARPEQEYQDLHSSGFDIDALPPVTLDEAIFDLPPRAANEGVGVEVFQQTPAESRRHRRYVKKFKLNTSPRLLYNHTVRYHNERDLELYSLLEPGEDSMHFLEKHGREDLMRYRTDVFDDKYARLRADRPCKTIVAHLAKDGNGFVHPTQVRSISFREAARVMSFHDRFAFCGSPSDQWVQLGNAVPPVLDQAIARSFSRRLKQGVK